MTRHCTILSIVLPVLEIKRVHCVILSIIVLVLETMIVHCAILYNYMKQICLNRLR